MKIDKKRITKNIFLLDFENQFSIASTFLRFQEYYESPEFRGKIFTLEEYKTWYIKVKGKFSYYEDWNGFNIPSYVLKPFLEGNFDPLTDKEKKLLLIVENEAEPFYIIGTHKEYGSNSLLNHEIAHGLFYTDQEYKEEVMKVLASFNVNEIKDELLEKGYCEEVLDDEVHAYVSQSSKKLQSKIDSNMEEILQKLFEDACKRNKISLIFNK